MKVYPIFLNNLEGRRCVIIGGNHEAERKTRGLLDCGAALEVISETLTDQLYQWHDAGQIQWIPRGYQPGDLKDAFLAIVSSTNPEATAPIWEEAQAEKVLLNAMDDIPHCSFVAGSVVERGPLVIAISTSGVAPILAVRLRQQLEKQLSLAYIPYLSLLASLREPLKTQIPDFESRKKKWAELVDSDLLSLFEQGLDEHVVVRVNQLLSK